MSEPRQSKAADQGRLEIRDDRNAVRIIARSQTNPLKAIAEFVQNSIDSHASAATIRRGPEDGEPVPRVDARGRLRLSWMRTSGLTGSL